MCTVRSVSENSLKIENTLASLRLFNYDTVRPAYGPADNSIIGMVIDVPATIISYTNTGASPYPAAAVRTDTTNIEGGAITDAKSWMYDSLNTLTIYEDSSSLTSIYDTSASKAFVNWVILSPQPTCTVTYNANGGTGGHNVTGIPSGGKHLTLTRIAAHTSRSFYNFAGWNTQPDGSGTAYAPGGEFTVTADITLYAQWTKKTAARATNGPRRSAVTTMPTSSVIPTAR